MHRGRHPVVLQELGTIDFEGDHPRWIAGDEWTAELVVGADGAQSAVRAAAGMTCDSTHTDSRPSWPRCAPNDHGPRGRQRFLSTGPLALLPLPGGDCSIVWSADETRAQALLAMDEGRFNAALTDASDEVLGSLSLVSARASFPLVRLMAERYVARNACWSAMPRM